MRKLFVQKLLIVLKESKSNSIDTKEILLFIEDILRVMNRKNTKYYKTNQGRLRI